MGLDYSHTCPTIDKSIKSYKSDIESILIDIISECCPLLKEGVTRDKFIQGYVDSIYDVFEGNFEGVRRCNEDMRKEADRQIEKAEYELSDANEEIKYLNKEIESLKNEISILENN